MDFPVVGYVPPEVLTELHFVLNHCAVELSPPSAAPAKVNINPNHSRHRTVYIMLILWCRGGGVSGDCWGRILANGANFNFNCIIIIYIP